MGNPAIVAELKACAENALARGFAILTVEPHDKAPWAKYSPHAVNSSTRDPLFALKAWEDGHEANYGVGCGISNLTVVDCDHGLNNYDELKQWMADNGLPETFTVVSGREGFGAHLYYSGAVSTCGFKIANVTGELKSHGGYVVGWGCIHPDTGNKYKIINNAPVASLPEGLMLLAKEKAKTNFPKVGNGPKELIPVSTRWIHLQSRAGALRNLGLTEEGIYLALKDFAANNCEDGANYPDDKIKNLATWAGGEGVEEKQDTIVMVGSPDPEGDARIPEIPIETIDGDFVGDLSLALTSGTFIPPVFVRSSLKTLVGAVLDGNVVFPGEETIHMRHWNAIIARPECGKSEAWKRVMLLMKSKIVEPFGIKMPSGGFFSSGEHAIRVLSENDNCKHLAYFDEMKGLFEKGSNSGSTLFSRLLELYENTSSGVGSVSHGKASFENVSLSMTGNFTLDSFDNSVSGKGAGGSGFLSRMTLVYSKGSDYTGDWDALNPEVINPAVNGIVDALKWCMEQTSKLQDSTIEGYTGIPWVPEEDADAKSLRYTFQTWLVEQKKRIEKDMPGASYAMRLEAHFKRDLLIRAVFQPEGQRRITKALVAKSIAWAKHELLLRERLWPVDGGNDIVLAERRIINAINKQGPLTKAGVQKFSNAEKAAGGFESWNRAWTNVLKAERVIMLKSKSDRGKEKFGFDNAVWNRAKGEWVQE